MDNLHGFHLICQDGSTIALVNEFKVQFVAMEDQALIVDHGVSRKQHQGFIELMWMGEVDQEFIEELECDPRILDVCVYEIPAMTDEQLTLLETV